MLSRAVAVVAVVSCVLGAVVGGAGAAWPGDDPGYAGERAVGPATLSSDLGSGSEQTGSGQSPLFQVAANVRFLDQTSDGRSVAVASVTLPKGGFVAVHDASPANGARPDAVRGASAYLDPGTSADVRVELDDPLPVPGTGTLFAVAHADTDGDRTFDFVSTGGRTDVPYESGGGEPVADDAVVTVNVPPTAALRYSPDDPRPGEPVVFDATRSDDADGRILNYEWRIESTNPPLLVRASDDGLDTFVYRFRQVGEYDVTLTVTDDDGATDNANATVVVRENDPPEAVLQFAPTDPDVGETVRFDGTRSTDDRGVVSYLWDLDGDGQFESRGSRVARSYDAVGRYPVTLLVSDGEGETDRTTLTVVVRAANVPPTARFEASPPDPRVGERVVLDASASSDPDGTVETYRWAVDGAFVGEGSEPGFSYRFPSSGEHTVTLTVTDDRGANGTRTERVVVGAPNEPPTARIAVSPEVPLVDGLATFDGTGSTDDGEILAYEWDLDGDGEFEAAGPVAERRYSTGGTFVVELLVVDDDGVGNTTSATVRVNEPPEAAFRVEPPEPRADERVTFDASPSTDDGDIVGYTWDFDGDGRADATGRVVRHTFETAGEKTVRLTVRDGDGATDSTTGTVTVPPEPTSTATAEPTATTEPTAASTSGPGGDGPTLRDAATAVGAAVAVGLVVLFRDEIAVLLRDLGLPRTTPRRGRRPRPARDVSDPDETEDGDDEPNRPPTASVRYRPTEPTVGRPVRFDGLGSVDPDGRVVSYRWSFEDGPDRRGATVVHAFEEAGEHEVSLAVTDDDGATGTTTVAVEVDPAEGELALVDVHPDAPGRKHLQQEYLTFGNVGDGPLDVVGWTVHDAAEAAGRTVREGDHRFEFTDVPELEPGATLTLHTGEAPAAGPVDREDDYHRYWGRTWFAVWNDDADVVLVRDADDNPVFAARYERVGDGYEIEPLDYERLGDLFPDAELRGDERGGADGT
jgi:PKD repeat protein